MFTTTSDEEKYNVRVEAAANQKTLGKRIKGDRAKVVDAVKAMTKAEIELYQSSGEVEFFGHKLTGDDISVYFEGHLMRETRSTYLLVLFCWLLHADSEGVCASLVSFSKLGQTSTDKAPTFLWILDRYPTRLVRETAVLIQTTWPMSIR